MEANGAKSSMQFTEAFKSTLLHTGIYRRKLRQRRFPGVAVLCYHNVRADGPRPNRPLEGLHVEVSQFESHCKLLRECCDPIGLDVLLESFKGGPLPPRPVIVTFDDGYRNVLELAAPILERYQIPAVAFVCSGPIDRQELFWFDALSRIGSEERVAVARRMDWTQLRQLIERFQLSATFDPSSAPLSRAEVKRLSEVPGMEIGSHTVNHMPMAAGKLADQRAELAADKAAIESWIGKPVRAFAYPFGIRGRDYNADSVDAVSSLNFEAAFSTNPGYASSQVPRLEIPRFVMLDSVHSAELAHRLAYSWK